MNPADGPRRRGARGRALHGSWTALSVTATIAGACLAGGCHKPQLGVISDGTVVVAGTRGGGVADRPKPVEGAALAAALRSNERCVPGAGLLAQLGPTCDHESENPRAAAAPSTGDLEGGKPAPTPEIRWYCDERFVVRVVLMPCDSNGDNKPDGVTPVEISVATHPPKG